MFEIIANHPAPATSHAGAASWRYSGQERRTARSSLDQLMTRMLDEIDYGMLLVGADEHVLYLNHAARLELRGEHPLLMLGRELRAQQAQDVAPLHQALMAARQGRRRLLNLGSAGHKVSVSVVPLLTDAADSSSEGDSQVLVVLGKRRVCGALTMDVFARSLNLTPAETQVLELLCLGVPPNQIAQQQGVAVCTVRTQIGAIRAKSGAASICDLVRQLAVLPPLVCSLRGGLALVGR